MQGVEYVLDMTGGFFISSDAENAEFNGVGKPFPIKSEVIPEWHHGRMEEFLTKINPQEDIQYFPSYKERDTNPWLEDDSSEEYHEATQQMAVEFSKDIPGILYGDTSRWWITKVTVGADHIRISVDEGSAGWGGRSASIYLRDLYGARLHFTLDPFDLAPKPVKKAVKKLRELSIMPPPSEYNVGFCADEKYNDGKPYAAFIDEYSGYTHREWKIFPYVAECPPSITAIANSNYCKEIRYRAYIREHSDFNYNPDPERKQYNGRRHYFC